MTSECAHGDGGRPMLSMAAGRTGVERRAIAEYVTGKPFAQAFSTTPSPQAMCKPGSEFNPLSGPRWNAWGVNASNTRYQDAAMAGLSAADVPKLRVKWAFGFPASWVWTRSRPSRADACSPARRAARCMR